jgi:hypothetical protein
MCVGFRNGLRCVRTAWGGHCKPKLAPCALVDLDIRSTQLKKKGFGVYNKFKNASISVETPRSCVSLSKKWLQRQNRIPTRLRTYQTQNRRRARTHASKAPTTRRAHGRSCSPPDRPTGPRTAASNRAPRARVSRRNPSARTGPSVPCTVPGPSRAPRLAPRPFSRSHTVLAGHPNPRS